MQKRVVARPELEDYLLRFVELSRTRVFSEVGQLPLQPSEIGSYLTEYGVSGGEHRLKFFRIILALDSAYMNHHFDKRAKADAK